jgi:hypothetical protein
MRTILLHAKANRVITTTGPRVMARLSRRYEGGFQSTVNKYRSESAHFLTSRASVTRRGMSRGAKQSQKQIAYWSPEQYHRNGFALSRTIPFLCRNINIITQDLSRNSVSPMVVKGVDTVSASGHSKSGTVHLNVC